MSAEYGEKLIELQEAINELQILKQIEGMDKLQILQEKKIINIQNDLQKMNKTAELSLVDSILPLKCRTCPENTSDDERLLCFDENYEKCNRSDDSLNPLKYSILKITLMFFSVLMVLILFLLITNIFSSYFFNLWAVFLGSFGLTSIIIIFFRKPMKTIFSRLA